MRDAEGRYPRWQLARGVVCLPLGAFEKLMLHTLLEYADASSGFCYPSGPVLWAGAGVDQKAGRRALQRLAEKGYLVIHHPTATTVTYTVDLDALDRAADEQSNGRQKLLPPKADRTTAGSGLASQRGSGPKADRQASQLGSTGIPLGIGTTPQSGSAGIPKRITEPLNERIKEPLIERTKEPEEDAPAREPSPGDLALVDVPPVVRERVALWLEILVGCQQIGQNKPIRHPVRWLVGEVKAFPDVNLGAEIDKADAWCLSNGQRGQKKDWAAFLHRWFGRAQGDRRNDRDGQGEPASPARASPDRSLTPTGHGSRGGFPASLPDGPVEEIAF